MNEHIILCAAIDKIYTITLLDLDYEDELKFFVGHDNPVWEPLHTLYEAGKIFREARGTFREKRAIGDFVRAAIDANREAVSALVGSGDAKDYTLGFELFA